MRLFQINKAEENPVSGSSDIDILSVDAPEPSGEIPVETAPSEETTEEITESESESEENIDEELKNFDEDKTEVKEDDKILAEVRRPSLKKILEKYPNIAKEFPDIKHVFYREGKYAEICGTVEDAKEMSDKAEMLDGFSGVIENGKFDVFVKALNDDQQGNFADRILPALHKVNRDLFIRATRPLFVEMFNKAYNSSSDENMKNSVLNMCHYLFGKRELPKNFEQKIDPEVEKQKRELDQEKNRMVSEKFAGFQESVQSFVNTKLSTEIMGRLDPKMSDAHKLSITNSILDDIDAELSSDQFHMSSMASFWRRAQKDNLNPEWRSKIITAYLGRARQNINSIIKKYSSGSKSEAKTAPKRPNSVPGKQLDKNVSQKSTKQVSDLDIINS